MENDSFAAKQVLRMLLKRPGHTMTRKNMLSNLYGTADANDLNRIIDRLQQNEVVEIDRPDGQISIKIADRVIELAVQKYPELLPKFELEERGTMQSSGASTVEQVDQKRLSTLERYIVKYEKMNLSDDAIVTVCAGLADEDTVRSALDKLRKDGELK